MPIAPTREQQSQASPATQPDAPSGQSARRQASPGAGYDQQTAGLAPGAQPSYEDQASALAPKLDGAPIATATTKVWLNMREAPSTKGAKITVLKPGASVDVLSGDAGTWLKVDAGGKQGFIYGSPKYVDYVAKPAPPAEVKEEASKDTASPAKGGSEANLWEVAFNFWTAQAKKVWEAYSKPDEAKEKTETAPPAVAEKEEKEPVKKEEPEAAAKDEPEKPMAIEPPAGDAMYNTTFAVVDPKALIRDAGGKSTGKVIPQGTKVYVIKTAGNKVQVVSAKGESYTIKESDEIWTSGGNLGGGAADIGMGNERSSEAAKKKADAVKSGLPPGRSPGKSPYSWKFGSGFNQALDGVALKGSLMTKLIRLAQWAIQNDMVTGDISFNWGMRSPAAAHLMSVAWYTQYGPTTDTYFAQIKKLPGGKDKDGNVWYESGWSKAQVQANANKKRASKAIAAAGYNFGNAKRAPHPLNARPGVSRHCTGGAADVAFPWRKKGVDAAKNETDVWGWDDILNQFGLFRPLPKGHKYQEYWHIEEDGKTDLVDEAAPPENAS